MKFDFCLEGQWLDWQKAYEKFEDECEAGWIIPPMYSGTLEGHEDLDKSLHIVE